MRNAAAAVVFDSSRTSVLLQKREDVRVWSLPGGSTEPNESFDQTAIRECREETGFEISITRLVGHYARPQIGHTMHLYEGQVIGGSAENHDWESVAVGWFKINALPKSTIRWSREMIDDVLANHVEPVQRDQLLPLWQLILLKIVFAIRNVRNRIRGRYRPKR